MAAPYVEDAIGQTLKVGDLVAWAHHAGGRGGAAIKIEACTILALRDREEGVLEWAFDALVQTRPARWAPVSQLVRTRTVEERV